MSHKDNRIQLNRNRPVDPDRYTDYRLAMRDEGPPYPETPYGATKTAELDIQFSIDPTYGLTKSRYGWFTNETIFDSTFFSQDTGKIRMETDSNSGSSARLRSAFPGQYTAHTIAEPGVGARIPSEHVETDSDGLVSLTHGEISFDIAQWSDNNVRAYTSFGISYETDATYFQLRSKDTNAALVPQKDWNIDTLDGDGPSGHQLQPQRGYVYLFLYNWYGEGAYTLAIEDSQRADVIPVHRYPALTGANPALDAPNMPIQATVENKDTASSLSCVVGGMQYATHGAANADLTRTTDESRWTTGGYISNTAALTNNAIDPFAEPGHPLVAIRRDENSLRAEKGLRFTVEDLFIDADQDTFIYIFDEYNEDTALTGATFNQPESRNSGTETQLQTDTQATSYSPSNGAILRGIAYASTAQKQIQEITGDATSNVPLQAAAVVTAALAPGSNATDAQPFLLEATEQF